MNDDMQTQVSIHSLEAFIETQKQVTQYQRNMSERNKNNKQIHPLSRKPKMKSDRRVS